MSNIIEDMRCPKCGQQEFFRVAVSGIAVLTAQGYEDYLDMQHYEHSWIECPICEYQSTVSEFLISP